MAGRRSGKKETLRSLLAEDSQPERTEVKDCPVISPPQTKTHTEQEKAKSKKLSPPCSGNQSPDPNCSICLGKLENKSFTDSCFHMFCFACLLEWSKVKAECPLCKQPFKSIIHNVRSYEDYDQYHIQDAQERAEFPWDSPEGYRFRYRTTVTFDRLMEAHYQEQQRQLRLLQRPTVVTTRRHWRRHRQAATSEFRRRIYLNSMRVVRLAARQTRQRKTDPMFYRSNPACTHRLVPWLNRELNALLHNQSEHVHFLMELIMDLIKRFEIESEEFYEHLNSYLGRHTRHFIHEFTNFARSPYDMIAYDQHAAYEPYTETIESDNSSPFSSAGSDIIIVDEVISTSAITHPKRKRKRSCLPSETHNPEPPMTDSILIDTNTTAMSGWDSPTPGPSGLFASPLSTETVSSTVTTAVTSTPSVSGSTKPPASEEDSKTGSNKITDNVANATSDSEEDSDGSSVVIVKVEKPWDERTPITLSSDSEEERMIKVELLGSRQEARDNRKAPKSSGSSNSSSDLIDVVTVTSDNSHKKHKHRHEKTKKSHKRKHSYEANVHSSSFKKSLRESSAKDKKRSSKSSKHSKNHESRKADYDKRQSRRRDVWHSSSQPKSNANRERSPLSCVYGYESSMSGKFGEFFQWLQYNEDRFSPEGFDHDDYYASRRSSYSGRRGRYARSRSRSRSYDTVWPNSSRSRSPTLSISPNKKTKASDKQCHSKRSRSSSVEIIGVLSNSDIQHQRRSHKKHKKHKRHKHKRPKTQTHDDGKENQSIEVVELEPPDVIGGKTSEIPKDEQQQEITADLPTVTPSCSKSPDDKKCKKHPTGHKKSSKQVKIKRDTALMKSLWKVISSEACMTHSSEKHQQGSSGDPELAAGGVRTSTDGEAKGSSGPLTSAQDCVSMETSSGEVTCNPKETTESDTCMSGHPHSVDDDSVEIDVVTCDTLPAQNSTPVADTSAQQVKTTTTEVVSSESEEEELDVVSVDQAAESSNVCHDVDEVIDVTSCDTSAEDIHVIDVQLPVSIGHPTEATGLPATPHRDSHHNTSLERDSQLCDTTDKDSHLNATPDRDSHQNATPDRDSHKNTTPDTDSHLDTTPDKDSHLNITPDRDLHQNTTPDKDSHLNITPDRDLHQNITPDRDSHLNTTPDNDSHLDTTPYRESQLGDTTDKDSHLNTTPDTDSHQNTTPDNDSHLNTTPGRDSHLNTTPHKDSHLNITPDNDSHLNTTLDMDSHLNAPPDRDSHQNATPDNDSHQNTTPDRDSHQNTTPDRESHLSTTPDRDSHQNATPDRESHLSTTPDNDPHQNTTPDNDPHQNTTPDRDSHLNTTPDRDLNLNTTPDRDLNLNTTPDKNSYLGDKAEEDSHLKTTLDRDSDIKTTIDRDSHLNSTPDRDSQLGRNSSPDVDQAPEVGAVEINSKEIRPDAVSGEAVTSSTVECEGSVLPGDPDDTQSGDTIEDQCSTECDHPSELSSAVHEEVAVHPQPSTTDCSQISMDTVTDLVEHPEEVSITSAVDDTSDSEDTLPYVTVEDTSNCETEQVSKKLENSVLNGAVVNLDSTNSRPDSDFVYRGSDTGTVNPVVSLNPASDMCDSEKTDRCIPGHIETEAGNLMCRDLSIGGVNQTSNNVEEVDIEKL